MAKPHDLNVLMLAVLSFSTIDVNECIPKCERQYSQSNVIARFAYPFLRYAWSISIPIDAWRLIGSKSKMSIVPRLSLVCLSDMMNFNCLLLKMSASYSLM